MKPVISARDVEELLRKGKAPDSLPVDAILTPSARDLIRDLELSGTPGRSAAAVKGPQTGENAPTAIAKPLTSKSSPAEIEAFFGSPVIPAAMAGPVGDPSFQVCFHQQSVYDSGNPSFEKVSG